MSRNFCAALRASAYLRALVLRVAQNFKLRAEVGFVCCEIDQVNAPKSFGQNPDGVVRELQHLQHARAAAVIEQIVRRRVLHVSLALKDQSQQTVPFDHVIDQLGAFITFHQERHHHAWKNDHVGKAENGEGARKLARGARNRSVGARAGAGSKNVNQLGIRTGHRFVI
jgi:hypothetical protein